MTSDGLQSGRRTGNGDLRGNRMANVFFVLSFPHWNMSGYSEYFNRDLLRLQAELEQERELK